MDPLDAAIARARALGEDAALSHAARKREAEEAAVRVEWSTSRRYSHLPGYFELERVTRGRSLGVDVASPPCGATLSGFDVQDRLVLEIGLTEFPGHVDETFHRHVADGIESVHYHHDLAKPWIHATFITAGEHGPSSAVTVHRERPGETTREYRYDERGRLSWCKARGAVIDEWDVENDALGRIVRVRTRFWPPGANVTFERTRRATTLLALRKPLLDALSDAIVRTLGALPAADPTFAVVLSDSAAALTDRLPPSLLVGSASHLAAIGPGPTPDGVWDIQAWREAIRLDLDPRAAELCELANQDIVQNGRDEEVVTFLRGLARAVAKRGLPGPVVDPLVVVTADIEDDLVEQVTAQVSARVATKLRARGWLP